VRYAEWFPGRINSDCAQIEHSIGSWFRVLVRLKRGLPES
jgi:hypothetical protein